MHDVVIVGGGFSGIGAGIQLDKAGIRDWVVFEEGAGVGGAWFWNKYPGVGVDIPSASYQFSFERNPNWTRVYAAGAELQAYAKHCVDKYNLAGRMRLNTPIVTAEFDGETHTWVIRTAHGETVTARHLINATGLLNKPKMPDIPNIDVFQGTMVHTARWDENIDLTGKRVAVVGTGASALQVIPKIADQVKHLTVFQRTPIWCLPKPDLPVPSVVRMLLKKFAPFALVSRFGAHAIAEFEFPLAVGYGATLKIPAFTERLGRAFLRHQVSDPQIREQLTPQYGFGCKRPSISNSYLRTFNRSNVTLVAEGVDSFTADGIVSASGQEHKVDIVILATGFKVLDKGNLPSFIVQGPNGTDLETWWAEHRLQAYEGVSVPGFPNYFMIFGPYGYNGTSYFQLIECQMRHIVRCLKQAKKQTATRVEVRSEANDRYFASMMKRRKHQAFFCRQLSGGQ